MAVRLATFNVENLFERAKALDATTWGEGEQVLAAYGRFTTLSAKTVYTDADKQHMLQITASPATSRRCRPHGGERGRR